MKVYKYKGAEQRVASLYICKHRWLPTCGPWCPLFFLLIHCLLGGVWVFQLISMGRSGNPIINKSNCISPVYLHNSMVCWLCKFKCHFRLLLLL